MKEIRLTIGIPYIKRETALVQMAIDSAASQLPEDAELILLPASPEAHRDGAGLRLPECVRVLPTGRRLSLVDNWNRCLSEAKGTLVHLLHDDDLALPGYYNAIIELARLYPTASLFITAAAQIEGRILSWPVSDPSGQRLMTAATAARFLLEGSAHCCASVALSRAAVVSQGPFRHEFPDCPDEEAYLRYAAVGGVAFDPRPLYAQRTHAGETRYASWRDAGFIDEYLAARIEGAAHFGPDSIAIAKTSSIERATSVAMTNALAGDVVLAASQLDRLYRYAPSRAARRRLAAARLPFAFPAALKAIELRRWCRRKLHMLRQRRASLRAVVAGAEI